LAEGDFDGVEDGDRDGTAGEISAPAAGEVTAPAEGASRAEDLLAAGDGLAVLDVRVAAGVVPSVAEAAGLLGGTLLGPAARA